MENASSFQRLGGEERLRAIVSDFIGRVYADTIIGFFFTNVDREQLVDRELELASAHLGGPHAYRGRPLGEAHARHPINSGHFHRRLWLLERTLRDHAVDDTISAEWIARERALQRTIVTAGDCVD